MAYPVDILTNVDHESLELAAEEYMSQLPCRNPNTVEYLSLPDSKKIEIGFGNVSFVPLYGADTTKKLLALFSPDDFTTVVGLYLLGQWWGVEDVLKTAEPSRTGLIKVSTLGERIVLYVLNRIVLRNEKSSEDVSFLCHCDHESAKILWKDGEAIGFYSYKPKGSLCRNFLTQCYQLPVMDTIFVRKCHRGKCHGVKILEDFVGSFRKENIGLKFPLSEAMYKVCEKYFSIYPADKEILWEVEKIGSPFQRTLIEKRLQKLKLKAEKDQVVSKLKFEEDDVTAPMEIEITKVQETTEYTVEIVEGTITDITKEVDDIPFTRCGRGSNLKRRGIRENSEERLSTNIIRVEDIEAGVESPIEVATEEHLDETFSVKESETVLRSTTDIVIATVTNISELRSSQKEEEQEIEKDKVTATLEGTPVTLLTTGEIKSQRGSEEECEMVNLEHTVVIEGATIGSIDQSQLQSVVDIEIVKMSTGTEEEQNENLEKKMLDEPEEKKAASGTVETYNNTEALEEVADQSGTTNKAEAESEVEEYKEKEELTVETDSTMDTEITQVGETVYVIPEISKIDQEEAPQQSSVESAEVQKLKTTPEENEETVENISKMLTLSEAKVVLVDLHKLSHKEASDNNREIDIVEQDEIKHTISSAQQAAEEIMRMEEQDGILDTTEGYNVATDAKRTPEQSTGYKEQEGEPEPETTEVVILSQVEKPEEKTNTEQAKEDAQKKGSTDTPSKSTSLRDQPVDPGVTVRCLRSTLKPIKITPVRRSTRSKPVIQQVESIEPQGEAKFRTDENPERDEVIAEDVGPEKNEKANTNVDETVVIESGSSELLKSTEIDYKEKAPHITEATEGDIPLVEAEPDEDVTEKVKEIKKMENKEANLAGQIGSGIEMSSLAQEKDVQEEEAAVSTERGLRCRTIRVRSPLRRKSIHVQKQEAEADVEHQERHTVVTKNTTESISMTEERVEEMDQEVNKMENKEANLAELEPVEEPDMIMNENEKTSASTEETVNVCLPIITTETSFESLDDMANAKAVETAVVDAEKSELLMGVEIDDQEKEAEPDEETEIEDGTPVVKLQKATVVLVDLNKLTQNTEEAGTPEVLKHPQMEEHLELGVPDKSEQELCKLASEKRGQKEEIQTQEDVEMIPEEEKIEEEKTVEEQNKLDKQDMTFEEQKPTEDLATMPAQRNVVESTKNENNQNEDEGVSSLSQEKEKTEIVTEKSADKVDQEGVEIDKEKEPQKSTVEATEKVIPFVEAVSEEDVVEKETKEINNMENRETNLAVTKDTDEEAPEMGEEANLEQQKNEPLIKNEKETAETEKPMEVDPVVSKEQTYVVEGTTIQIEEVSQVESTETNQNDNAKITRRSSRLSAKSVTSTQNTRKSTRLHKAELEPVKEADMSRNEYKESSATTEGTVNVCIPIITVETNLESPDEIPNTNVEKTSAVGPETSVLLMGVETEDKKEAPKILEEVTLEAEPGEEVEKDDGTPIVQLQKATVVLVDLNKLSQSTEGESDIPEGLVHSKTEEQLELDEPDKSEYQLHIQTSEHEEQEEELQKEENTEKTPEEEEDKMEEVNSVEVQNKLDKQEMTFEGQKLTDVLEEQNDVKETEIVEEYKAVIDEDVEEAVTSVEHPDATTMADKTNIIKEKENDKDIALKEKQTDSDVEMSSLAQEAPEAVQEILEEKVPFSTERILRHRKIKVQSPPRRKSRRVQNQEAEADVEHQERHTVVTKNKTEAVSEETVEEMDQEVNMRNEEASLAELEPVEEDTEKVVPLVEGEPEEDVIEKGFEEINKMENKVTSLENDAAPEMGRDEANLEQHQKDTLVKNDKETAESEKHMEMDKVPLVCKEQTYVIEETTIQVEEKVSQMESTENKSERITRRGLRISAQSATSTQKTRKSTRLRTAELEPVKEADMSRNEGTSSMTVETVNVCVPIITAETNMGSPWKDGDSMSRKVETTSYEQERDTSTDKGKVDESLPDKATDEQDETKSSTETTENEIMVEMDKTQKVVEGGVQDDEKGEPPQEDTDQKLEENIQEKRDEVRTSSVEEDATQQEEVVSKEENVGETNPTNEFKTTAVEGNVALESSDQETPLITRSLRYRTVTVQFTPRRKSKRLHRLEVESEKETKDNICGNEIDSAIQDSADDLNIPIEEENEALNAEKNITEFENLKTKEGEGIIQVNIEGKAEETGTKDDTVEEGNEILFEINESNIASPEITEQDKTQEENLEKDVQVPKEQEEEVSSVQEEEKPLQEKEKEGAVEGNSFDLEETAVERRTLRKRVTVETAAPRKSKRLRKQEHDEDSEQVKEAVMGQTETVEVTFTDNVELSSEVPAAVFEGSNLGGEIQQNISGGTKSDGDCDIHEDTKTDASEAQEEQKEKRINKPQTDEDNEEVMEQNSKKVEETGEMEKVIEQHVETEEQKLESSTNEGFTLELEVEETSDQEENKADKESRVAMEAPKDIFTSAEKSDEGEENISDEDEKGLASEKHVLQSSSIISSSSRRSTRLQMHESKKNTTEDESDSEEAEVQQTVKQRHQKKRKAITDLTPARRSKRYVREKIV